MQAGAAFMRSRAHIGGACQQAASAAPRPGTGSRRQRLVVAAGLLDLLRGGGAGAAATSIETDADGEALKAWMVERGLPQQQLVAASIPGAGRGLVAAHPISKGETLLCIPPNLVLTPAAAQQQSCLRALLEETPLPAWSVLALWLAEARAAGSSGEWWPYIRLLPEHTGCVLEWGDEEVEWLRGSQLYQAAAEIRGAAEASWQEMQPLLAAVEQRGVGPCGAFTREALWWAFSMLLSRLVRLSSLRQGQGQEGEAQEALLPFADLLNHSPDAACFLDWSAAESAVVLQADRRYSPGQQVHISYGQKSGGELLLSYGFCPEPGSNPHDGCKLRLHLHADPSTSSGGSSSSSSNGGGSQAAAALGWKAAALQQHGKGPSELFPLRMQAAPFDLVHYAALAAAEVGSQEEAAQLAQRLFVQGDIPPALQQPALEAVIEACKAAQGGYPSSLEADRAELEQLEQQEQQGPQEAVAAAVSSQGQEEQQGKQGKRRRRQQGQQGQQQQGREWRQRRRQVLQVLVHERQVLARTLFIMQQELKDLKRMARQR